MKPSSFYALGAALLLLVPIVSAFALPMGYTFDETCPRCHGDRFVNCEICYGSGKCWVCEGTGRIWYMPPDSNWCAACQGTGVCYRCGGSGSHGCEECEGRGFLTYWMFTQAGSATALSIIDVLLFLPFFGLSYAVSDFYLSFNEWVYNVRDMGFWFNPSFMTWLFAKHRKRWAKWQAGMNAMAAVFLGSAGFGVFSLHSVTADSFTAGILVSILIVSTFSFFVYKSWPESELLTD